ncbi:extracellular calcium-sensing receptor-like [Kryptolebias marmoratus]|uniref:extracellular calcium-sensing receptor-like n=1 Tax=Kryptolebias marmoratus TaxID=37003 RepID=UPI0018ACF446|nr:extracellular calcium-sensing receptor-like [Kryptolebias marmoratus]
MTSTEEKVDNGYRAVPYSYCTRWNDRELKFARTMIFTVEEINRDPTLLPGVSLGYRVFFFFFFLKLSHLSTCACLSEKTRYPTFFRTVPSDHFQSTALVQLMEYFDWRWVGIIYSQSTYAEEGTTSFVKEAEKKGICVEYWLVYSRTSQKKLDTIVEALRKSSSKVVLMFMSLSYVKSFLSTMEAYNITGKQWVGSESWITQKDLVSVDRKHILYGAMGFALPDASIPGLGEFLLSLKPSDEPQSAIIKAFWEIFFDCSFSPSNTSTMCTGTEDLKTVFSDYTDVTYFREENNVYKAVYAVAYTLHAILQCQNDLNPTTKKACVTKSEVQPKFVLENLKYVNFTTKNGAKVFFNENGDSVAQYDLVNWQIKEDGSVEIKQIGQYDDSLPEGQKLKLKKDAKIVWAGDSNEVPKSVCREPCPPGTRKALNKNKPVCCFDCFECPEGTISNQTNSVDCLICPPEFWPNEEKGKCLPKRTEYLSYKDIMGALLTGFSTFGMFLSLLISIIFFTHKETPIVRANNSELSFLLLFSLKLCFLCSLTFIGRPTHWSCMLRHTAFSITFVLCISCVLGKTIVVLMAFKAKLPGSNVIKWFGPPQQRITIFIFTLIQVVICILWLTISPPFPSMNMQYYKDRIILECALGSAVGFWAVLGYIGLLAVLCFILAFLARKLPDSFNEARLITFSMLIFCAVWITFIPAYVSSPGKFTVAVEIFAILASSFGLLLCIFAPKCYIIILKPEQNTKKHLMGKVPPRTL